MYFNLDKLGHDTSTVRQNISIIQSLPNTSSIPSNHCILYTEGIVSDVSSGTLPTVGYTRSLSLLLWVQLQTTVEWVLKQKEPQILWFPTDCVAAMCLKQMYVSFKNILIIYFCLCWVFLAVPRLSEVVTCRLLTALASSCCRAWALQHGISSCAWAQSPRGMWNLPGPGIKPVSSLADGLLTNEPPGKSQCTYLNLKIFYCKITLTIIWVFSQS